VSLTPNFQAEIALACEAAFLGFMVCHGELARLKPDAKHLTGWVSEPDRGYADAIAKGFARSGGEYMCWLNSSDVLLDGALDEARRHLSAGNADLIFGDDYYIDDADRVIFRAHGRTHSLRHMMLYGGWTPLQDACFWKRSLYDAVGGLDPRLTHAADFDLFLRMSLAGRCVYVPVVFSAFRRHAGQKSIGERVEYRRERERCRVVALDARQDPWGRRRLLVFFYWFAVRVRARAPVGKGLCPHPLRALRLTIRHHRLI